MVGNVNEMAAMRASYVVAQQEADDAIAQVKCRKQQMLDDAEVYEAAKIRLHEATYTKELAEAHRLLPIAAKRYHSPGAIMPSSANFN